MAPAPKKKIKVTSSRTLSDGTKEFYDAQGKVHRDGGPARIFKNGKKVWFKHGTVHRADGPAIEWDIRGKTYGEWFFDGEMHREGGPALYHPGGYEEWHRFGQLHRENGPAVTYEDGRQEWYLYGKPWPEGAATCDAQGQQALLKDFERAAKPRNTVEPEQQIRTTRRRKPPVP